MQCKWVSILIIPNKLSFDILYSIWLVGVINGNGIWFTSIRGGKVWRPSLRPLLDRRNDSVSHANWKNRLHSAGDIRNKNDSLFLRTHTKRPPEVGFAATGNRHFAEYRRLCRVYFIGHSAKTVFAECQIKYTRKKTLDKMRFYRVPFFWHSTKRHFAECIFFLPSANLFSKQFLRP